MEDERPLFQGIDELERTYAPEELPPDDPDAARVRAEEGEQRAGSYSLEPPEPAPVANLGTAPSAAAAPPNIGHADHGGAPGDPNTQAGFPLDDEDDPSDR
jgi:hypothetical protein